MSELILNSAISAFVIFIRLVRRLIVEASYEFIQQMVSAALECVWPGRITVDEYLGGDV